MLNAMAFMAKHAAHARSAVSLRMTALHVLAPACRQAKELGA